MQATSTARPAPILIVGAAGTHGGTGGFVARALLDKALPVRALVRTHDERAQTLQRQGAEVCTGDLRDRRSLAAALAGVETAFFTYPVSAGIVEAAANFASAARAAGLRRLVVMSMGAAHPDSPSPLGRAQWLAENVLEWAGFACLHLRIPAFFFENIPLLHSADIGGDGVLRNSYPDLAINWIAGIDAAKLAVAALLTPERFGTATAVYPSGGYQYSHAEIARIVGAHLGRTLRHETISKEAWRQRLLEHSAREPRINAAMAEHISALGAAVRAMRPPDDSFGALTGDKPLSLPDALTLGQLTFQAGHPAV